MIFSGNRKLRKIKPKTKNTKSIERTNISNRRHGSPALNICYFPSVSDLYSRRLELIRHSNARVSFLTSRDDFLAE